MTITHMPASRRSVDETALPAAARCDICGALVTDVSEHLTVCVDHELEMFAVGRRAS